MRPTPLVRASLGLTTAIAILTATALPAAAASTPAPQTTITQTANDSVTAGWLTDAERKALAPFVTFDGKSYSLDAEGAKKAGVSQKAIDAVNTAVARLNDLLAKQNVVESKDSEGVTIAPSATKTAAPGITVRSATEEKQIVDGITVKVTWFGLLIHLDSFVTGKVQAGVDITKDIVQIATSVLTLASLGSLLPVTLLASAAADLGSKVVSFCTTRKGELYVYITWAGVPVCNPLA
ncbi:hypothetical protein ACFP1Z_00310 [Streptomyces gamaensis]|uniref:Uncharacterized protein n=1 Tax=Streptomyces gamaensis TaxID=1763542 RepID=A0ABW0YRY8_9ACTN